MLIGLDHVIIGVNDLASASAQLGKAMGLVVTPGGAHPGWGTHNAIVRFGLDYLELLAVRDEAEAQNHPLGAELMALLRRGEGYVGFAMASDAIDADVAALRSRGVEMGEIRAGSRRRPDGRLMQWQMANVADDLVGRRLPFLIEHGTPAEERINWAPPRGHPLTATRMSAVALAVGELESATARYEQFLGYPPAVVEEVPALPARRVVFEVGGCRLELLQPKAGSGGLHDFLQERGDGLFLVTLAVPDIDRAVQVLRERGTAVGNPTPRRRAPLLDPAQTLGARYQLVEQP
jgi:predicted enzyme related to lactoylglutathione lyase